MSAAKNTSLAFNEDILNLIAKHYPRAVKGDIEQNSQCASDISVALGGLLALAYRLNGEVVGRSVLTTICQRIIDNATAIDQAAGGAIRKAIPNLNLQ